MREESDPLALWCGCRVFGVDGSKINVPHEMLTAGYKAPNRHQYYPQGLMSTLYHLGSGLIYDGILSPDKGERICLLAHMERLLPGDVLVLDRGYFSYLILVKAIEKDGVSTKLSAVIPQSVSAKEVNSLLGEGILKKLKEKGVI